MSNGSEGGYIPLSHPEKSKQLPLQYGEYVLSKDQVADIAQTWWADMQDWLAWRKMEGKGGK